MKSPIAITITLLAAAGIAVALGPSAPGPTAAQVYVPQLATQPNTVTVNATGEVLVPASAMKLSTAVKSNAELADEAVANFAQTRARTMAGLADAELPGLEVISSGLEVEYMTEVNNQNGQVFIMNGMPTPESGMTCKEKLEVRFSPQGDPQARLAVVARAIDIAIDLGLDVGVDPPNPYNYNPNQSLEKTVEGVLEDEAKAKAEAAAQARAMERAGVLAANLADLSGRKLGRVNSVTLQALTSEWKGLGAGMQVRAVVVVTFDLQ